MTYEGGTLGEPWEDRRGPATRSGYYWRVTERKPSGEILSHKFQREDEARAFHAEHTPEPEEGDDANE